jgi:diguanylate cyclase (GGDEF)-like protein
MSLSIFHLAPEDERKILLATTEDARELSDLLDVHVGDLPDLDSLLVDTNDDLIPQPSNGQSVIDGSSGQADAMIDTTTGVGNRAHFDQELARLFEQAHRSDGCLGVVMVDADRFKSLKDTVGQMAAETALQAIAHRLRESLGDATIVCRTGAAQFGVIAPDTSRLETARLAERARRHIEREYVDLRDTGSDIEAVPVSASFGVAALEPRLAKLIHEPKRLASLAEQALFAAKQSGRNCVRVFKPRESASDAA